MMFDRNQDRNRRGLLLVCISALLVFGSYGAFSVKEAVQRNLREASYEEEEKIRLSSKREEAMGTEVNRIDRAKAAKIFQKNQELLILANKDHEIPKYYQPKLRNICKGRLQASEVLYEDLVRMLAEAGEEGYQFYIASAYRSEDYQQKLIDHDVEKLRKNGMTYEEALGETLRQVMPAGYSEHETGLALDILVSGNSNLDATQEKCPANQWLQKHCMKYGFILRYPKGKEEITGIDYEPWHFRYVGVEAARYLSEKNLTLEEFWDMIEESDGSF